VREEWEGGVWGGIGGNRGEVGKKRNANPPGRGLLNCVTIVEKKK